MITLCQDRQEQTKYDVKVHTNEAVCGVFIVAEAGVDSFVYTRETLLDRVTLFDAGGGGIWWYVGRTGKYLVDRYLLNLDWSS
eukprot:scaffold53846_cov79-Cyclotella_meneghiniana.AAC.1